MKKLSLWIVVILSVVVVNTASATMVVRSYQAEKHDRFYTGTDPAKAFIGDPYNWSGVGQDNSSEHRWATMVSSRYFLTADHYAPAGNSTITFYEDNTTNSPRTYTVDNTYSYTPSWLGTNSDLCMRRLTADIPDEHNITYYPILSLAAENDYIGREIYVNGKSNRVGRNIIDRIRDIELRDTNNNLVARTRAMEFNYDNPGVGDDECYLMGGDSGGPSFAIYNNSLALVGIHSYHHNYEYSGDNFVPNFIDDLNDHMGTHSLTLVPEPAALVMLLGALAAYLCWRKLHRNG